MQATKETVQKRPHTALWVILCVVLLCAAGAALYFCRWAEKPLTLAEGYVAAEGLTADITNGEGAVLSQPVRGTKVTYVVEGVTYFLQPWDLLLVGHDLIHRPIIDPAEPYERVVIWLGREWLERRSDPGEALDTCFDTTRERGFHLLRFDAERRLHYMQRIQQLEEALRDRSFGAARMADTLCQQMLIDVNRDVLRSRTAQEERDSYRVDPKMEEVLRYILDHLGEELTVESLSKRFFISRYYLMHRFKAVTGYTVHQYISQKRLLRAGELIRAGVPVMKAAEQAGFEEYSTFLRAFRGTFHMSPREFR